MASSAADFNIVGDVILSLNATSLAQIGRQLQLAVNRGFRNVDFSALRTISDELRQTHRYSQQLATQVGRLATAQHRMGRAASAAATAMNASNRGISQVGTSAARSNRQVKGLNNTLSRLQANIRSGVFSRLGYAAAGAFFSIAGLHKGLTEAVAFEKEMVKIQQVTQRTAKEIRSFSRDVNNVAVAFGVSSSELIESSRILAQAGFALSDVNRLMQVVAKTQLSPTFGSARSVTEGMIAVMRQFKLEAYEVEAAMGSINKVASRYSVESEDIIQAVRRTGSVFASMGGDLNELISIFSTVRETTREAPEAIATGLRTIFTRLKRPSTLQMFSGLGVELTEGNKFLKPLEMIERIGRAIESAGGGQNLLVSQLYAQLGGIRQAARLIPLLENIDKVKEIQSVAESGATSLTEDQAAAMASLNVEIKSVIESFQKLFNTIALSSGFRSLVSSIASITRSMNSLVASMEPIFPLLGGMLAYGVGRFATGTIGGLRRSTGGFIPGVGNTDTVPAMLTPGEFVINKTAAKRIGYGKLAMMNARGYQAGGMVGDVPVPNADANVSQTTFWLNNAQVMTGILLMFGKHMRQNVQEIDRSSKAAKGFKQVLDGFQRAYHARTNRYVPGRGVIMPGTEGYNDNLALNESSYLLNEQRRALQSRTSLRRNTYGRAFRRLGNFVGAGGKKIISNIGAGGVLAGGLALQSQTSRTSAIGQGVGSALSMGATGALIGSSILPGWGTAIGAATGAALGLAQGLKTADEAVRQDAKARQGAILMEKGISSPEQFQTIQEAFASTISRRAYYSGTTAGPSYVTGGISSRIDVNPESAISESILKSVVRERLRGSDLNTILSSGIGRQISTMIGVQSAEFSKLPSNLTQEEKLIFAEQIGLSKLVGEFGGSLQKAADALRAFLDDTQTTTRALNKVANDMQALSFTWRDRIRERLSESVSMAQGKPTLGADRSYMFNPDIVSRLPQGDLESLLSKMLGKRGSDIGSRIADVTGAGEELQDVILKEMSKAEMNVSDISQLQQNIANAIFSGNYSQSMQKNMGILLSGVFQQFENNRQKFVSELGGANIEQAVKSAVSSGTEAYIKAVGEVYKQQRKLVESYIEEAQSIQILTKSLNESSIISSKAGEDIRKFSILASGGTLNPYDEAKRAVTIAKRTDIASLRAGAPTATNLFGQDVFSSGISLSKLEKQRQRLLQEGTFESTMKSSELSIAIIELEQGFMSIAKNAGEASRALQSHANLLQQEVNAKQRDILGYLGSSPDQQAEMRRQRILFESTIRGGNISGVVGTTYQQDFIKELTRRNPNERVAGRTIQSVIDELTISFAKNNPTLSSGFMGSRTELERIRQQQLGAATTASNAAKNVEDLRRGRIPTNRLSPMNNGVPYDPAEKFNEYMKEFEKINQVMENNTKATNDTNQMLAFNSNALQALTNEISLLREGGTKMEHTHAHEPIAVMVRGGEGLEQGIKRIVQSEIKRSVGSGDVPIGGGFSAIFG